MSSSSLRRHALLLPVLALAALAGLFASQVISADAADPTAALSASPNPMTFNDVAVGASADQVLTVRSSGTAAASIVGVDNVGRDRADFSLRDDTCTGQTLATGTTCTVTVRFKPLASTTRVTSVRIQSSNACTYYVTVAGGGVTAPPAAGSRACEVVTSTVTTPGTTSPGTTVTTPGATSPGTTVTTPGTTVVGPTATVTTPASTQSSAASVSPTTVTTTTTTPGPSTTSTGQALGVTATSPKMCKSRRTVTLNVRPRNGIQYAKIVVRRNDRVIRTLRGTKSRKIATKVVLTGLPRTRVKLQITATTTTGKVSRRTQYFVTCIPKKPTS